MLVYGRFAKSSHIRRSSSSRNVSTFDICRSTTDAMWYQNRTRSQCSLQCSVLFWPKNHRTTYQHGLKENWMANQKQQSRSLRCRTAKWCGETSSKSWKIVILLIVVYNVHKLSVLIKFFNNFWFFRETLFSKSKHDHFFSKLTNASMIVWRSNG